MRTSPQQEEQWRKDWERERARGYSSFVWRGFLLTGLLPGAVMSLLLAFSQPRVGGTNVGTLPWTVGLFILVSAIGLVRARWWWYAAEKRYLAGNGHAGS